MNTKMYEKGLSLKQFISELQKLEVYPEVTVLIANDEEYNQVYKGFFIRTYKDAIIIAPLSGCELNE